MCYRDREEGNNRTADDLDQLALAGRSLSLNQVLLIYPQVPSTNENKMSQNQGRGDTLIPPTKHCAYMKTVVFLYLQMCILTP